MTDRATLAAQREAMWQAVANSATAAPLLINYLLNADTKLHELPAHPVLWSRCRSLVLTEELTEWAWLHWFSQKGVWPEEKSTDPTSVAMRDRILTPERQLVIDASTSLLAPNANASSSIVPFTTVADSAVRTTLANTLRQVADAFSGLTTLPIPTRLARILTDGVIINRLPDADAARWKLRTGRPEAPPDPLAAALLDLLVNTGCTDTYTLLATRADRAEFVSKLCVAIPADAPQLTFTD